MSIEIRRLFKQFGRTVVCDHLDLSIASGELVALLGPSGSGKTSLLRVIAGLEQPDSGSVHFEGEDATRTDVRERRVGFVFQHYALFPHMTIFENVAFGLRVRPRAQRPPEAEIRERVDRLLRLMHLGTAGSRFPSQLSGGQRQRIALARALAVEPRVLLLDEPFGALDAQVRKELRRWLRRLHDEMQVTTVFVTHDQEEAMEVADRVVVMNRGRIEQAGTPDELIERPASPFVLQFLGDVSLVPLGAGAVTGGEGTGFVRPQDWQVLPAGGGDAPAAGQGALLPVTLPVTLSQVLTVGGGKRLEFHCADGSYVDVALSRAEFEALRLSLALEAGRPYRLRATRVTRFEAGQGAGPVPPAALAQPAAFTTA